MSTFEPGTVAVATVRGVPNVRVFRRHSPETGVRDWAYNPEPERGLPYSCDSDAADVVTDVRPLVVLDHSHIGDALNGLFSALHGFEWAIEDEHHAIKELADEVERQTKPPRIPEPGLWGVVQDGFRILVRHSATAKRPWLDATNSNWVAWDEIDNPTPVRDGIEVAS